MSRGNRRLWLAAVSRDEPAPRLLVAREEETQHARGDRAAFEVIVGRKQDERVGAAPPALAAVSERRILHDRAGPREHALLTPPSERA